MTSKTRELKKTIKNDNIRKNVTKIYFDYDVENEESYLEIFFKEETVRSTYSGDYMVSTTCPTNLDLNGWLDEIAYIEE